LKELIIIPLEVANVELGYHLMLQAKIGRKKVRMLVDTGASMTVFDKSRLQIILNQGNDDFEKIEQLSTGLGTNSMEGAMAMLPSLHFGTLKIRNFSTVVLDISHVNESYQLLGFKSIDGVLGSDILMKYQAEISFASLELRLWK
jgi:predicted aspartyl protease